MEDLTNKIHQMALDSIELSSQATGKMYSIKQILLDAVAEGDAKNKDLKEELEEATSLINSQREEIENLKLKGK
jgi:hypothetical protein